MAIETLGDAFQAGWSIRARCAWGRREGLKSIRECVNGSGNEMTSCEAETRLPR